MQAQGRIRKITLFILFITFVFLRPVTAQNIEKRSIIYNSLVGGFSAGLGGIINKKKDEKWYKVLARSFAFGTGGGLVMYGGKKINYWIGRKQSLGYAYLSRAVYSAGNSLLENAAANRKWWSVWHYDIGFVRVELRAEEKITVQPRIMPSAFCGTVFLMFNGKFDLNTTLKSGTPVFRTQQIAYSPRFLASTPTNGFLFRDSLRSSQTFYEVFAHEMVHAFQFMDYNGSNYFFKPLTDKWKNNSPWFNKWSKWIYGDLNYEVMAINYFLIQKGHKKVDYCSNFLENEAETLSTGRPACP